MAKALTLILSNGGLRSLVATAAALSQSEVGQVALLHFRDGRAAAARRQEHARRQAQHFQIARVVEADYPQLHDTVALDPKRPAPPPQLVRPQLLVAGLAVATQLNIETLVWPVQVDARLEPMARVSEQLILLQQFAELDTPERGKLPAVRTPLLELSDQQVIELGGQLGVPWHLAWTCQLAADRPCHMCAPCRQRRAAFDAAGMEDPQEQLAPAH